MLMSTYTLWFWLVIFAPVLQKIREVIASQERVYLRLDKHNSLRGDVIYWKGYIITEGPEPESMSRILYLDLFHNGELILHQKCFILHGISEGQIEIPDSLESGTCWLRAITAAQYSRDSAGIFYTPIYVDNPEHYCKYPRYSWTGTRGDTTVDYNKGVHMFSAAGSDGVTCFIKATDLFNRWDRPLMLRIKGLNEEPKYFPLTLSRSRSRQSIDLVLSGIYGYMYFTLLDGDTVLSRETVNVGYPFRDMVDLHPDSLDTTAGGRNVWRVDIRDSIGCNVSVSVTDADKVQPPPMDMLSYAVMTDTPAAVDCRRLSDIEAGGLEIKGRALTRAGKPVAKELVLLMTQDSTHTLLTVRPGKDGNFSQKDLFFMDTAYFDYQRNTSKWNADDVGLSFFERRDPPFVAPSYYEKDDSALVEDTSVLFANDDLAPGARGFNQVRQLKTIVIKETYQQKRDRLDQKYTSGMFSEPAPFFFDLVKEPDPYAMDIFEYLRRHLSGFQYVAGLDSQPTFNGKRVVFFVNEEQTPFQSLAINPIMAVAYIKAIPSYSGGTDPLIDYVERKQIQAEKAMTIDSNTFKKGNAIAQMMAEARKNINTVDMTTGPELSVFALCIYTRHNDDWKYIGGTLHQVALAGFARIKPFHPTGNNRWTLFWSPNESNHFLIRFTNNNSTHHFRVCIEGVDLLGNLVEYKVVLPLPRESEK